VKIDFFNAIVHYYMSVSTSLNSRDEFPF